MIGALVTLISLEMTRRMVAAGMVYASLTIVGASNTTPIVIETDVPHNLLRPTHAVISGVGGNDAANDVWVMNRVDDTHLALSTYSRAGAPEQSVGDGVYTSGGIAQYAFPDGAILLGRRNVEMQMAFTTPRIVFVPTGSTQWQLDPYGGVIPFAPLPRSRAAETQEQQYMLLRRQLNTERQKFEVHVSGVANPPDPDFGDFDITQALYHTLYAVMFDLISPDRAKVLGGAWVSQTPDIQQHIVHGAKWVGIVEIAQPVTDGSLDFVPVSTDGTLVINLINGTSADATIVVVHTT